MNWKPIETAPRDGKMRLYWSRERGYFAGNWPFGCARGVWRIHSGEWFGSSDERAAAATHWMPLPEPTK